MNKYGKRMLHILYMAASCVTSYELHDFLLFHLQNMHSAVFNTVNGGANVFLWEFPGTILKLVFLKNIDKRETNIDVVLKKVGRGM